MDKCTQELCDIPSEYICSCKSISFCKTHILEHVTQSKIGTHNFVGLFDTISAENLSIYSDHLIRILHHLDSVTQEAEKKLNAFIKSASENLILVRTKINALRGSFIKKLKDIHNSGKINKKTTDKLDLVLLQDSKDLQSFLSSANAIFLV